MARLGGTKVVAALASVALTWGAVPALANGGSSSIQPAVAVKAAKKAKTPRRPALNVSSGLVVEGDVIRVTATVRASRRARRAVLQRARRDLFGTVQWDNVASRKVKGKGKKRKVVFRTTVTDENQARYRVAVTYKKRKTPVLSKQVRVQVWRWIPLHEYGAYYTTGGTNGAYAVGTMTLNGQAYKGWGTYTYSRLRSWEDRFTPGRNCRSFRGMAGVTDLSDDGASGEIILKADEQVVWESPTLTPGMVVEFEVPLDPKPYRFAILAANTSEPDSKAWPAIGDPAFLCTGV